MTPVAGGNFAALSGAPGSCRCHARSDRYRISDGDRSRGFSGPRVWGWLAPGFRRKNHRILGWSSPQVPWNGWVRVVGGPNLLCGSRRWGVASEGILPSFDPAPSLLMCCPGPITFIAFSFVSWGLLSSARASPTEPRRRCLAVVEGPSSRPSSLCLETGSRVTIVAQLALVSHGVVDLLRTAHLAYQG